VKPAAIVPVEQHFILSSLSPGRRRDGLPLPSCWSCWWPFSSWRAALDHPGRADRRLRPGLCHGDVRERFDHHYPAVCPVSILRSLPCSRSRVDILFTALMLIPWMLTFPDGSSTGLGDDDIGNGVPQILDPVLSPDHGVQRPPGEGSTERHIHGINMSAVKDIHSRSRAGQANAGWRTGQTAG